MIITDAGKGAPKPRSLHTDDEVHAIAETPPERRVAHAHWRAFLAVLGIAADFMGGPASLILRGSMEKRRRNEACRLLRVLETMLRRILIVMAASDTRPLAPARPSAPRKPEEITAPQAAQKTERVVTPETLPVHFAMSPRPAAAPKPAQRDLTMMRQAEARLTRLAARHARSDFSDHKPIRSAPGGANAIAARLEAVIRVYQNPDAYVTRLRRKLAAQEGRGANRLFTHILITPAGPWLPEIAEFMADACGDAYDAIKILSERPPPIAGA